MADSSIANVTHAISDETIRALLYYLTLAAQFETTLKGLFSEYYFSPRSVTNVNALHPRSLHG